MTEAELRARLLDIAAEPSSGKGLVS